MTVEEVKQTIKVGIEAGRKARLLIVAAREEGGQACVVAVGVTHDSTHPYVHEGRARCGEASREARLVIRRIDDCRDGAADYLKVIM